MAVTVKYFASLREQMGRSQETIPHQEPLTVAGVWQAVCSDPLAENVLCAVNMEYVGADHEVREGDEVAFFPPVTGG
ncbi:MAG: molybdopterin synthase sulfur carrier subunit [Gammaproteobacteria bacterium]|jgi:molybdopterin synthase sulfur carrier subunit